MAWWRTESFKRELGLSADQVKQIDKTFEDTWPQLKQLTDELVVLEDRLSRQIAKNAPEQQILMRTNDVESKRGALNVTRTMMLYRMRLTMKPTQRGRFEELHQAWQEEIQLPCQQAQQREQRLNRQKAGPDPKSAPAPRKPSNP